MKHTANTTIKESPLKNGGIEYRIEYKGEFRQYCRTLKSAKTTAEKFERFQGHHYARHYSIKRGFLVCNTNGEQDVTTNLEEVTCPRCLSKLKAKGMVAQ